MLPIIPGVPPAPTHPHGIMGAAGARAKGAPMAADACQERLAEGRWRLARRVGPHEAHMGRVCRYL